MLYITEALEISQSASQEDFTALESTNTGRWAQVAIKALDGKKCGDYTVKVQKPKVKVE